MSVLYDVELEPRLSGGDTDDFDDDLIHIETAEGSEFSYCGLDLRDWAEIEGITADDPAVCIVCKDLDPDKSW